MRCEQCRGCGELQPGVPCYLCEGFGEYPEPPRRVDELKGSPTGGTFSIVVNGIEGRPLPWNASQSQLNAEIDRLHEEAASIRSGRVVAGVASACAIAGLVAIIAAAVWLLVASLTQ